MYQNLKWFKLSEEFERMEEPPPPIIVKGEEEYEVEAILKHKRKGVWNLYLVMWQGYFITKLARCLNRISEISSDPKGLLAPCQPRGIVLVAD